jgi:hypothetical protein
MLGRITRASQRTTQGIRRFFVLGPSCDPLRQASRARLMKGQARRAEDIAAHAARLRVEVAYVVADSVGKAQRIGHRLASDWGDFECNRDFSPIDNQKQPSLR